MAAEDKQIQVWANPIDHGPRVVFGARCVAEGSIRWNLWARDGSKPSTWHSICDALDEWSADGEDRLWHDVEIVAAPAAIAAKHVHEDPAAWPYEQRWWWCNGNWGPDQAQVGPSASLRNVSRVDAVESFRCYLREPLRDAGASRTGGNASLGLDACGHVVDVGGYDSPSCIAGGRLAIRGGGAR